MPEKLETPVPPWVQIFAALNPEGVQIVEMSNPIITGMARPDQPIVERMGETVFLLRNCLKEPMVNRLEELVDETFDEIRTESTKKDRATQVGHQTYHAWQAVRHQNCSCFYYYAGTRSHTLYKYTPDNLAHAPGKKNPS